MASSSPGLTTIPDPNVRGSVGSRTRRFSGLQVLIWLALGTPVAMIACYFALIVYMGPTEDDAGYLHALHGRDSAVFLDHTDREMLSIGHQLCRMIESPSGSPDLSYAGDVSGIAYEYLCSD